MIESDVSRAYSTRSNKVIVMPGDIPCGVGRSYSSLVLTGKDILWIDFNILCKKNINSIINFYNKT